MRNPKEFFKHYFVSPMGILNLILSAGAGLTAGIITKNSLSGLLSGGGVFLFLLLISLFSGAGARSAVDEKNRRFWLAIREGLKKADLARERLETIRIADPEIQKLSRLAGLKAAEYLQACEKKQTHDPAASFAIEECIEIIDLYLTEVNETAVEKRFNLEDAREFQNPKERVMQALNQRIQQIDRAALEIQGWLSAEDRLSIKEDLS